MEGPARSGEQAADVTELDGAPSWRADVLFDRQKVEPAPTTRRPVIAKLPVTALGPILRRLAHRH